MVNDLGLSKEELALFLEETEEQLEILETDLMELESAGYDEEVVARIFRAAHTIKGSSATLGHQQMTALTHALENLLDQVRKQVIVPDETVMQALFSAVDNLREMEQRLRESMTNANVDTMTHDSNLTEVLNSLRLLAEGSLDFVIKSDDIHVVEVLGDAELLHARIAEGEQEGMKALSILVKIAPDSIMPAVRAYQIILNLEEIGEVLWSQPTMQEIEAEEVGNDLRIIFLTDHPRETIRSKLTKITDVVGLDIKVFNPKKEEKSTTTKSKKDGDERRSDLGRTVRIDVSVLDSLLNMVGELVIDRNQLAEVIGKVGQSDLEDTKDELLHISNHLGLITNMLQEEILQARLLPVDRLFKKFPRMVRDLVKQSKKEVDFRIEGENTELDRSIIEYIGDPLIHLLRNAVDHGVELPEERVANGKPRVAIIKLSAERKENQIVIEVADDGRGIDSEYIKNKAITKGIISTEEARTLSDEQALNLIFVPGFSTAEQVSEVSGRGVGMDVVRRNIENVGGRIDILAEKGQGSTFRIMLPLTMATIRSLLIQLDNSIFALPLSSVLETIKVDPKDVQIARTKETLIVRGEVVPLVRLKKLFEMEENAQTKDESFYAVLVSVNGKQVGLVVDSLLGEQEVVIKSLGSFLGDVPGMAGATVLGDGTLALILDVSSLLKIAHGSKADGDWRELGEGAKKR